MTGAGETGQPKSGRRYVDDGLRREDLTEGRINELIRESDQSGLLQILPEAEREASRRETLARHDRTQDLWIFGYGSLMWNPAFHHAEAGGARIFGYHRRFCMWMPMGRGSPERPGMMLALQRGGSCHGRALRIPAAQVEAETRIVWRREIIAGGYCPTWVRAQYCDRSVRALTFVANPLYPRYDGGVPLKDTVRAIATAEGRLGRCRDYLHNLVMHLDDLGIADGQMHRLYKMVEAHADLPRQALGMSSHS